MPTVIDALVVTLQLDTTGFKKGAQDVDKGLKDTRDGAARTGKEMEARGKQAASFFGSVKNEAVSLFAVLLGSAGIITFARSATTELSALGRAARNIGISAQDLMAFRNAVAANGGNADAAADSFQRLTDEMEQFKVLGKTALLPFLNQIGAQQGESALQVYMKFVQFAQQHKDDVKLIRLVGGGLGLDEGSINEALRGIVQVQKDLADARERGVPTDQQIENVTKFQRAQIELKQALEGVGNALFADVAPALTRFLDLVTQGIIKNPELAKTIGMIGVALTTLAAIRLPLWLIGILGGSGAAGAGAASAGAGWLAALSRILAPLGLLALTGQAGGQDDEFSRRMNEKWLRDHPAEPARGFWETIGGWLGIRSSGPGSVPDRGVTPGRPVVPPSTGAITDRQRVAHDYFIGQGWSEEQTAGMLAYLRGESGFDPDSFNSAGGGQGARGIGQWRGERIDNFRRMFGHDPIDPAVPSEQRYREQLAFMNWELTQGGERGAGILLRGARTPTDAANIVTDRFGRGEPNIPSRAPAAEEFYRRFRDPGALRNPLGGEGLQASNSQPSFNIASLIINTQATDAPGIARDIGGELRRQAAVTMANTGLA